MTRLDTIAPSLMASLLKASATRQRAATLAACECAIRKVGIDVPAVEQALCRLRAEQPIPFKLKCELDALVQQLDDEYFRLSNDTETFATEGMREFTQARAISALVFAADTDPVRAAYEAIYEAVTAVDFKEQLIAAVMEKL